MRVAIIEDEPLATDHLIRLLHKIDGGIEITYQCDTVKKAVSSLQSAPPVDLVFLDIQLADGLSFDIFDSVSLTTPVIFTTAYNEYAIKAFKVNSVDYLLKPVALEDLYQAIQKFESWQNRNPLEADTIEKLAAILNNQDNSKERFIVKVGEHIHSISIAEILFFYSKEKATYLQTTTDRRFLIDYSLEQLEDLTSNDRFFRINRAYLIGIDCITDIISFSNSRLKIKLKNCDDDNIIVSRDRVQNFKKWLDR